jgi:hypothetical protein
MRFLTASSTSISAERGTALRASAVATPAEHLFSGYCAVYPPSTMMSWPVVNAAPGELSQSTALAISSGVPMRPAGVYVAIVFFTSVSPSPKDRSNISVWIGPGETLLTRTPCLANSSAAVLVRPMTANLLAT